MVKKPRYQFLSKQQREAVDCKHSRISVVAMKFPMG
jgi:hypothetical protein